MKQLMIASALLAYSLAGFAADDNPELNPVTVTATRGAVTADQSLSSVTVITRADIERLQAHSIQDLLTGLPGVSIASNGDYGKSSSLFLRGTNSDHVLVLIDGIKVGSATLGSTAFEQLPVDQIDHIEIVRGPRSSLYGSEAIGGVIQIFTRHGQPGEGITPSFSIGGGSHNTYQGEAGASGSLGNAWYNGSIGGFFTHGIPTCVDQAPTSASCFSTDPRQGYQSVSGSLSGGYRWDNGAQLTLDGLRTYGDTKFGGSIYSGNQSKLVQQVLGGKFDFSPASFWHTSMALGQSEDQSTQYYSGDYVGFIDTRRNTASWQNDLTLADNQALSLGADFQQDHVISDTDYAVRTSDDAGAFGLYQGTFGRNNVQLSLREDQNQQFGNHLTGGAAWGYRFGSQLQVRASYGTAFKAPTFNQLYYPFYGSPDLRPESSRSGEIGFSGKPGIWDWSLSLYQTNIDNLIDTDPTSFTAINIDRARIRGAEAQFGLLWHGWRARGYLSWIDPRDRSAGNENHLLSRRAQQTARLDLDREFGRFNVGTSIYGAGRRFNDAGNTQELGGYGTLDLRTGYQFSHSWLVQAQLKNLFNKDYQTVQYYRQLGRTFFITLRYHPVAL